MGSPVAPDDRRTKSTTGARRGRNRESSKRRTSCRIDRMLGSTAVVGWTFDASSRAPTRTLMTEGTSLTGTGVLATHTPKRHWLKTTTLFEPCAVTRKNPSPSRRSATCTYPGSPPMAPV